MITGDAQRERRLLRRRARACGWSRRPSTSTSRTPTTSTSATRPARPARSSPGSSSPARAPGRAGLGEIHTLQLGVAVRGGARLLGRAARRRRARAASVAALRRPRRPRARARRRRRGNPPLRAVAPGDPGRARDHRPRGRPRLRGVRERRGAAAHRARSASPRWATASTGSTARSAASAGPTTRRPRSGRQGAGTVHHIAWASRDEDHLAWQERVADAGGLRDRRARPRLLPARSTSASRAACCSRSRRSRPASRSTRTRSTSARRCALPDPARAPARAARARRCAPSTTRAAGGAHERARSTASGRPPATPAGLLVLHHGRGADEHDLLGLADVLDPERRLHVVTPRAPLHAAGLARLPLVRRAARRLPGPRHVPRRLRALAELPRRAVGAHRHRRPSRPCSAASRWAR